MKKNSFFWALGVFVILLTSCSDSVSSNEENEFSILGKAGTQYVNPNTFDEGGNLCVNVNSPIDQVGKPMQLWMGVGNDKAGTLVGQITFKTVDGQDYVVINLTGEMFPYMLDEAHIHFAADAKGIPKTNKGNPIPGQFEVKFVPAPEDMKKSIFKIPVDFDNVGAIHLAVKKYGGLEGFAFYLTDEPVTLKITQFPDEINGSGPSYFKFKISNGGFISEYNGGNYEGWCIDVDKQIALNKEYQAYLFSSYENLPSYVTGPGKIEKPENFDLVNYLINKYVVGQSVNLSNNLCAPIFIEGTTTPATGILTYSDIQRAIWSLIDDNQSLDGIVNFSQERVNAVLCDVKANGEGFKPGCDQKIVFLVVPTDISLPYQMVIGQPVISSIQVPCETMEGTAWGDGYFGATFPGSKQWGTWFKYDQACTPE